MEKFPPLCSQYLELQAQRKAITQQMAEIEKQLEQTRFSMKNEESHVPNTFFMRLEGQIYSLEFDDEGDFLKIVDINAQFI